MTTLSLTQVQNKIAKLQADVAKMEKYANELREQGQWARSANASIRASEIRQEIAKYKRGGLFVK